MTDFSCLGLLNKLPDSKQFRLPEALPSGYHLHTFGKKAIAAQGLWKACHEGLPAESLIQLTEHDSPEAASWNDEANRWVGLRHELWGATCLPSLVLLTQEGTGQGGHQCLQGHRCLHGFQPQQLGDTRQEDEDIQAAQLYAGSRSQHKWRQRFLVQ